MSKEHFEPVTARSLTESIKKITGLGSYFGDHIEAIIEPHIRKPSDEDWMKSAAFLLQKSITSYDNTKSVNTDEIRRFLNKCTVTADMEWVKENMRVGKTSALEADIEWLTRGCMRIMHGKSDGDGQAYRELKDFISQKVSPTSAETKSVPQRCEEAYDEATNLIEYGHSVITIGLGEDEWCRRYYSFLQKINPFKEADIVDKEEGKTEEHELLPFNLKAAQEGANVVTGRGEKVKIVADNMTGDYPILATITADDGIVRYGTFSQEGRDDASLDATNITSDADLFILKEPETIEMRIFKHKTYGTIDVLTQDERFMDPTKWELIKTITVTI